MSACPPPGRRSALRGLERDVRHAARAHAGARQARRGARAARAAAAARRAAAHRARLGDPAVARARRLRRLRRRRSTCTPTRPSPSTATAARRGGADARSRVGDVTRELLAARPRPGRAGRDRPDAAGGALDRPARRGRRARHLRRRPVATYFAAATRAALVLAEYRAPYRGRSTPVNAWWGRSTWP